MPIRIISEPKARKPLTKFVRVQAKHVTGWMAEDHFREHVPLVSLIKEWDNWPAEREQMIAEEPVSDREDDLCRVAAVVHALCERDSVKIPDWVWQHRSGKPIAWGPSFPTSGGLWERMIEHAPPACAYHNVWFDYQFISSARRKVTKHNYQDFIVPTPT